MKRLLIITALIFPAFWLCAQTNETVKLAIVAASPDASEVCDLLTAQLSANDSVRLLERDQIDKIYREQGTSAENRDDLKLGRLLGADGLLILDVEVLMETNPISGTPSPATNLTARLIAVKPGVILTDEKFSTANFAAWSSEYAGHLSSFLPKLTLDPGDAIGISVVNLRSAISSEQEVETEKELKSLTLQRLSQERRFFVLERERMQEMEREKGFNADESAFWDGSYLLEGTVDQNGYSSDAITVNVRLTPPQGGAPLSFQVSGPRTNLTEVINQMGDKVAGLLKIQSVVPAWSAADEASQFFAEAKWALKWKAYPEAEAAADSAWALGKQDLECALVRVRAYGLDLSSRIEVIGGGESSWTPGYDAQGHPVGSAPTEANILLSTTNILADHPWGVVHQEAYPAPSVTSVRYAFLDSPPSPENIDRAIHALELYYAFSQSSPDGQPKVLSRGPDWEDWHDSDWYKVGIYDLTDASRVLQNFNLSPASQNGVADKLADLRSLARSVAALISQSPSVHDSYFVGDRPLTYDEPHATMNEQMNIFRCEVTWGCYWQEKPEDTLTLYRNLMASPVFSYIHDDFWIRPVQTPRLIAWNDDDQKRIPAVWNRFLDELNRSPNVFLRLEARALVLAGANNETDEATAFTNLMNGILDNSDAFITNNVDVLFLDWQLGSLAQKMMRETVTNETWSSDHSSLAMTINYAVVGHTTESLKKSYDSYYVPQIEAIDQKFSQHLQSVQQKAWLANNTPFDELKFVEMFQSVDFSRSQAQEILPLLITYKSNLVSQYLGAAGLPQQIPRYSDAPYKDIWLLVAKNNPGQYLGPAAMQHLFDLEIPLNQFDSFEENIRKIVNAANPAVAPAGNFPPQPVAKITPPSASEPAPPKPMPAKTATNVMTVGTFIPIPTDNLFPLQSHERLDSFHITITTHQAIEGKLLFDLHDTASVVSDIAHGRNLDGSAVALFDPPTKKWTVIDCPPDDLASQNKFYYRTTILNDELFHSDDGKIWKYDKAGAQWQPLAVSDGNNYELFAINGHLYAANESVILEISSDGKATHLLASVRRQPPISSLDTTGLGTPTLFEGPGHSLRVCTDRSIYTWNGKDWDTNFNPPSSPYPPDVFPGGVLFRTETSMSFLALETNTLRLCLWQKQSNPQIVSGGPQYEIPTAPRDCRWKMPADPVLSLGSAFVEPDRLLIFFDHSTIQEITNDRQRVIQERINPKDGYEAELLNFSPGLPSPQKLSLQFASVDGCPPLSGGGEASPAFGQSPPYWMAFLDNGLFFGLEMPRNGVPFSGDDRLGVGYEAGIWLMPLSELDSAIASQKKVQSDQIARDEAAAKLTQNELLAKYDLNHNGVIDPEEKEAALKDPAFLAAELDTIDANQNGILDPEEFAFFDASHQKHPSATETAAIETVERLLAQRLIKKFDTNGDGLLQPAEFQSLLRDVDSSDSSLWQILYNQYKGAQPDIDSDGLTTYLKRETIKEIAASGIHAKATLFITMNIPRIPDEFFDNAVDDYWQNLNKTN
jgi:hypothetical protein